MRIADRKNPAISDSSQLRHAAGPGAGAGGTCGAAAVPTAERSDATADAAAAIEVLGRGLCAHPANDRLREQLRSSELSARDFYRLLQGTVYRLLVLGLAEQRELLHPPATPTAVRQRYRTDHGLLRLRLLAEQRRQQPGQQQQEEEGPPDGSSGGDGLWPELTELFDRLGSPLGWPELGLPHLGSLFVVGPDQPSLTGLALPDAALLEAVRLLAPGGPGAAAAGRAPAHTASCPELLGAIHQRLLELHPVLCSDLAGISLHAAAGHERKTSGSYYTPGVLIDALLDSALEPLLDEAMHGSGGEDGEDRDGRREYVPGASGAARALLALRICDPACGSGHFLLAAARRVARRLATLDPTDLTYPPPTGPPDLDCPAAPPIPPGPTGAALDGGDGRTRRALRLVVEHCLYGVDVDELAVRLCQAGLWLEAAEPGRPLSSLDRRIRCGNALLGATPALLARGLPDAACSPLHGDDRELCSRLRRQNSGERPLAAGELTGRAPASSLAADGWCAAFFWPRDGADGTLPPQPGNAALHRLATRPAGVGSALASAIAALARRHRFFHWHLAFPEVLRLPAAGELPEHPEAGWSGGFDVLLANPPWERIKLQEKEFFASLAPAIAGAGRAATRRRRIADLAEHDPRLASCYRVARRTAEAESLFVHHSGRFPLTGRGDANTYALFAETCRQLLAPDGRAGLIVPSGLATDETTRAFFASLTESSQISSCYDFENRLPLFPGVHRSYKFCLLTLTGTARPATAGTDFVFFARQVEELRQPECHCRLNAADIALCNPNTRTCPVFRSQRAASLTGAVYRRVPVLLAEGDPPQDPWQASFLRMLDMTNDSGLFRTQEELSADGWHLQGSIFVHRQHRERHFPLWEDWMLHHFDHRYRSLGGRFTTPAQHGDPCFSVLPRYWVAEAEVRQRSRGCTEEGYLLGFRNRTRSTDARTVIASVLPAAAVGNTVPLLVTPLRPLRPLLQANLSSFALDWVATQKLGGLNLNFFIVKQLPVLPPATYAAAAPWDERLSLAGWLLPRVLELAFTSWDLLPFARDCGWSGPPFRWDEQRRFLLRAELDAAYLHLYGFAAAEAEEVLESFGVVKRRELSRHGSFRTGQQVLATYAALQQAMQRGSRPYRTLLDPPPADPQQAHPPRSTP